MNKRYPVSLIIVVLCLIIAFAVTGFRQISAEAQDGQHGLYLALAALKPGPIGQAQTRPVVTIVSPAPNQQFGLGQPITVVANVFDPQGVV